MTSACGVFRALIECSHTSDSCHFMSTSFRRRRRFALDSDACSPPHDSAIFLAYCLVRSRRRQALRSRASQGMGFARGLARRRQAGIRHVHLLSRGASVPWVGWVGLSATRSVGRSVFRSVRRVGRSGGWVRRSVGSLGRVGFSGGWVHFRAFVKRGKNSHLSESDR